MKISKSSIVIIVISGCVCISIYAFCRMKHVQVAEIEEYYAVNQQHRALHYMFKISFFVITVSLAFNLRSIMSTLVVVMRKNLMARLKKIKIGEKPKSKSIKVK